MTWDGMLILARSCEISPRCMNWPELPRLFLFL